MQIDWAVVFATIVGPIAAVQISELLQRRRQARDRKEWAFRTIWVTRSAKLNPEHVAALNHLDFLFPEAEHPKLADAWHLYQAHLNSDMGQTEAQIVVWHDRASILLQSLIGLMAKDLGFPFSQTMIASPSYSPKAHAAAEARHIAVQAGLIEVLHNSRPIAMRIEPPPNP